MGIFSSIGTAVGGYFGGTAGAAIGGAIGGSIDGKKSGSNAAQSKKLSAKAIEYLEKEGKTAEEIQTIAADVGAYEDVFAGYSDEIYAFKDDYAGYGEDYGEYEQGYQGQADKFNVMGDEFSSRSGDQWDRYTEKFQPVQDQAIDEVMRGPQTDEARAIATGDVNQQFDVQRDARVREQQRMGINPNSGRADAQAGDMARDEAVAVVGARNKAAREEDDRHWAKLLTVNQMGANLPSQSNDSMARAGSSYSQAVNTAGMAENSLGRQVGTTDKQIGVVGSALNADNAAKGALIDKANISTNVAKLQGGVATGYGAAAQSATEGAIADSKAQGTTGSAIVDLVGSIAGCSDTGYSNNDDTDYYTG